MPACGGFFNPHFGHTGFNGFCHAAQLFNLINDLPGFPDNRCRKRFNIVRTAEGIDDMTDLRFLLNNDLRVAGNPGGQRRGKADSFIKRVGVKGLGAAEGCRQRLQCGADDIVVGILLRETPAGGLHMRAQYR